MVELETIIFCNRQYNYMMIMSKLHIAKLIKHEGCYDPITQKEVCKRVSIVMPRFISGLYRSILDSLNDKNGRMQLQKLINIGAIRQNSD